VIVRYTAEAYAGLAAILAYFNNENPRAAIAVLDRLDEVTDRLAQFPKSGHVVDDAGVRMVPLVRFPYLVFYRIENNGSELSILSIRHAARRHPGFQESSEQFAR